MNPTRFAATSAVLVSVFASSAFAQDLPTVNAPANACVGLKSVHLQDVRIDDAVDVRDSVQRGDNVRVPHCRVSGVVGKGGAFVVMLPNQWNQRLLMGGNGGYAGTINRAILAYSTVGYVTVSTNTGHEASPGGGARWALDDHERVVDFGHLAVHRTVEVAKSLTKSFYGSDPRYSYFTGCSNGGRQGLMEVERYPDDFDGVAAAAPAAAFSVIGNSFLKNLQAVFPDPTYFDKPIITQASLDLLSGSVLDACDMLDGVKDGVIEDPRDCKFKLSSLKACPNDQPNSDCLTAAQRAAIGAVYSPTMDENKRVIYPGQPFGGENLAAGWPAWITGRDSALMRQVRTPSLQSMFAIEGGKYMIFGDSTWDYSKDRGAYLERSRETSSLLDADNPNISKFLAHKGKLILWHGWSDPALNPLATIDYYMKVLATSPDARDNVRLFMVPGLLHCGGGNGQNASDAAWLRNLTDWVEHAKAPERVIAEKREAGKVTRTRPLCSYPQHAVYTGQGSTDDAANFVCRETR